MSNRIGIDILGSPTWQGIGAVVTIVSTIISVFIAYDIYQRSAHLTNLTIEEKYYYIPTTSFGSTASGIEVTANKLPIKSLVVYNFNLINTGNVAILPNDYIEPLRIPTVQPWEIIGVDSSSSLPSNVNISWTKISTNTYEMSPTLLNAKDEIQVSSDPTV